ncbi:hypothetical protein FA15DRAFT_664515 [Coprinopsis marcescibilis]|uniref:DNA polymerase lambda n=1 Tax=Coprinopsis marcescibilis TaxID=230819 RepID=A0A5C3LKK5_COPMA|nr:hypothetical protein FA15DRAFT_664515 [Coprinopsis marcescibilis]
MDSATLQQLFEEQDEIMALPDEEMLTYIQRIRMIPRPPRGKRWSDLHHEEGSHPSTAASDHIPGQTCDSVKEPILSKTDIDSRSSFNRSVLSSSASSPMPMASRVEESPPAGSELEDVSGLPNAPIVVDSPERALEATDSYRPDDEPGSPTMSLQKPISRKRGLSPDHSPNQKRRRSSDHSAAETTEAISPISTFPRSSRTLGKTNGGAVDQGLQLQSESTPQLPVLQRPQIKPVKAQPKKGKKTKSSEVQNDPCSSPIEEPSAIIPQLRKEPLNRTIASEPSNLLLEVKERVARYKASKHHLKTVPLGQRSTIVIDDVQLVEHNSIISDVSDSDMSSASSRASSRASSPANSKIGPKDKQKITSTITEKGKKAKNEKPLAKHKKEKPKSMTPSEYAQHLQSTAAELRPKRRGTGIPFLEGYKIFYTGGDMRIASETTRKRMELIVRHGGTLIPQYDPKIVTHIVTDATVPPTLHALGLKKLEDIPDHIPTVKWSWVTAGISRSTRMSKPDLDEKLQDDLWQHAAFALRMEAGMKTTKSAPSKSRSKEKSVVIEDEDSHISEFTQEPPAQIQGGFNVNLTHNHDQNPAEVAVGNLPSPPSSPELQIGKTASSSKVTLGHDPLAEFYDQAKAERIEEKHQFYSEPESESDIEIEIAAPVKKQARGWTCDSKEAQVKDCPNQDIIDKLAELMELHKAKLGDEDHWRAFAYSKAIRALRHYPKRISTYEEARKIKGVGDKTARKIAEILETGDLRRIGYEKTEDVQIAQVFQGIYGVGRSIAYKWYSSGCRSLEDIRKGKGSVKLSPPQEIGLRFYDDINDRMPRNEARAIFELIKPIALSLDPKLSVDIMGSYRRRKATCGDIDILITRSPEDGRTHAGILPRLLRELHAVGILTEDLALPEDPTDLEAIYRGLCRLPDVPNSKRRRIDFLTVPFTSRGAALIYYTGDDIFNRAMRLKANVMGYSLNQRGLFAGVIRDPRDRRVKMEAGHLVASETEEEIFKILGVPWQEPHERVRG